MSLEMKSALITFGLGMLLIFFEWNMARKKKEGFTATDRQNVIGLFWMTLGACGLVAFAVHFLA
jgi:hypothetical protein